MLYLSEQSGKPSFHSNSTTGCSCCPPILTWAPALRAPIFIILLATNLSAQIDTLLLVHPISGFEWVRRDIFMLAGFGRGWADSMKAIPCLPEMFVTPVDTINEEEWSYYLPPFDTTFDINNDSTIGLWSIGYMDTTFLNHLPPGGELRIDSSAIVYAEFSKRDTANFKLWLWFDRIIWWYYDNGGRRFLGIYAQGDYIAIWGREPILVKYPELLK